MKKRNGLTLATIFFCAVITTAQNVDLSGAFNISDRSATITNEGVRALERIAAVEPGLELMLDQTLGPFWQGSLEIVQHWTIPAGTRFTNSGLDRRRTPFQHPTTASKPVKVYQVRSRVSGKTVVIKNDCLNPVQTRIPAVPKTRREAETTWNLQQVTFNLNVVNNNIHTSATATATATTAPISIVINNVSQAPLMMMGGGAQPFVFVRDSRGLLSLGTNIGGTPTRISNFVVATGGNATGGNANSSSSSASSSSSSSSSAAAAGGR